MATIDDLVKATRSKRVQVTDLPDAPKLQPTVRSGGQYTVAVQQAGRNKLMDLADALSKVNPILQQYGAIQKAEREYQREQGELFAMEKPEEAMAELEAQRDKTKAELRKLREQGVIQEAFDPEFLLGIRAARAKVQAKEFRNQLLTDPELLQTDNPVGVAQERVGEFLSGLDSQYAKQQVAPLLDSIGNEFVNTVTRQQQDAAIAQGKTDWLNMASEPFKAWTSNEADLNSPEFREWFNDPAGAFKGNREFVLQEMIQPMLMDMTERGNAAGAMRKIQQLKDWKINDKGAKFITSTMQDSLNALERTIISQGAYWQQQTVTTYNTVLEDATAPFDTEFLQRLNEGKPITENFFKDWSSRAREELKAKGVKPNNVEEYITGKREEANKSYNRQKVDTVATDSVVLGAIRGNLNLGIDQRNAINIARDNGELSLADYKTLLQANANETDFETNVMRRQPVRDISDIIQNRFSDKAIKDGIPIPMVDNSTNIVKDITGITKKQIPGNTLSTLRLTASQIFRDEMRKERDRLILQGMGQLSRPELDRQLDDRVATVYENISPKIEEMVKTKLKTAQFNLGSYFDKDVLDGFDKRDPNSIQALNSVLHRIGFEEDDYQGKANFLNSYRANHID